jgi:hypothetical protein
LAAANYLAIMPAPIVWSIAGVAGGKPPGQVEDPRLERRSACAGDRRGTDRKRDSA